MAASGVTPHSGTGYAHTIPQGSEASSRPQSTGSQPSNGPVAASQEVHPSGSPGDAKCPSSTSSILTARPRRGSSYISDNSWHEPQPGEDLAFMREPRGGGPPGGGVPPAESSSTRSSLTRSSSTRSSSTSRSSAGSAPAGNPRQEAEKLQKQYWNDQMMFGILQANEGVAKDFADKASDIVGKWHSLLDIFKGVVTK
jgi:hypothetical protein